MRSLGLILAGCVLLAGCGDEGAPADGDGDVPITQRAIAAMTLEHAPEDTTSRVATYTDRSDPEGALGADLRYRGDGEYDGDLLRVFLSPPSRDENPCGDDDEGRCDSREVDGGTLTLSWDVEEPEEDPGYVAVVLQRDEETVSALWFGDTITGDPRDQDLFISIDTLEDIAQDPRISLTTSQEVVDAGADLDDWDGGEPDPHAYDRVPSTDEGIGTAYWMHTGGYAAYHDLRPSPLKADFGPGAVGARFWREHQGRDYPRMTIDVVAGARPSWLADDVCATPRFSGHCVEASRGRHLAWVPGPAGTGEIWGIATRDDEVVAIRYADLDVPEAQTEVEIVAEWWLLKGLLADRRIGLETEKQVLDAEL
ncbi:MAG: hypothetical protein EON52_10115 [Actinomycetales bacterium]|nr:MAG: hypothetical protein EON52_10115 [Actinomycetales bacterium]